MRTVRLAQGAGQEQIVQLLSQDGPMEELCLVLVQYYSVGILHRSEALASPCT